MEKIYFLLTIICFSFIYCQAQYVTISDARFRDFLINKYPACFNGAGEMDTSCTAIIAEDSLDIYIAGTFNTDRVSLTGIMYFDELKYLNMSGNYIDINSVSDPVLEVSIYQYHLKL